MTVSSHAPRSILDTDLYKLTMQQAVLHHFPKTNATYKFTLRDKSAVFTKQAVNVFQQTVDLFGELALTDSEHAWLKKTCPYFTDEYLFYLRDYRFRPTEQVRVKFVPTSSDGETGTIEIDIHGPWVETIFWEVPLMATLSEVYFKCVAMDWSYDGQKDLAYEKGRTLLQANCVISEFGTRRRRSFQTQDIVVESLVRACQDTGKPRKALWHEQCMPAFNLYTPLTELDRRFTWHINTTWLQSGLSLSKRFLFDVLDSSFNSEWFMGVAALTGYEDANSIAMNLWEEVYPNALLIALTDTFSSETFFKSYASDKERALRWQGLRQDSGDPFVFGRRAKEVFDSLGINPREKIIVYSDALDIDKALGLKEQADDLGLNVSFGIGTFLTNDFKKTGSTDKSKALNMVIKLSSVDDHPCVKLSDDLTKVDGLACRVIDFL
ncbi:Nicotinate phosphoribosyltransferase [Mycena sanguinolenta]|uniref:Nicotinate phosphoribosyltransferase n=1 Tax=Mycena sanguinolenta TaxID=230812 RepID=A0A8H7DJX3_9AGAR|nr:Nicotinate phosphoribosyltransferase [Mycena sanguinolenta]